MNELRNFRFLKYMTVFCGAIIASWWIYGGYILPFIKTNQPVEDFIAMLGYAFIPLFWGWIIIEAYEGSNHK